MGGHTIIEKNSMQYVSTSHSCKSTGCLSSDEFMIWAICDHHGIFTEYELGWPSSVVEVMVFKQSEVWMQKEKYFAEDEYILGDKGM